MRSLFDLMLDAVLLAATAVFWVFVMITFPIYWAGIRLSQWRRRRMEDAEGGEE